MKQTALDRKRIVSGRHELALINDKDAKLHPIC
jgi:hypothetical protein